MMMNKLIRFGAVVALCFAQIAFAAYPTDIRQKTMLGYNVDGQAWSRENKNGKTWFEYAWDTHHADRWGSQPAAYEKHFAAVMFPVEWEQIYTNQNDTPTSAEARDHTWDGYIWNNGGIDDPIAIAKQHPRVAAGDAVIIIKMGFSATATPTPLPNFIKNNNGWWWESFRDDAETDPREHLRFDVTAARQHVEDAFYAMTQKYGNDPAVSMIVFGEYFNGKSQYHPSGLNKTAYKEAVETILDNVITAMPRDGDGKRMMIGLSSPSFGGTFVRDDIIDLGIVPIESNVEMVFPPSDYALTLNAKYWSDEGIHIMSKGDSQFFGSDKQKSFSWADAPQPNPFGFGPDATLRPLGVDQYLWYKGSELPTHSVLFNIGQDEVTQADINDAISKFARGGSEVGTWGVSPPEFPGAETPSGGGGGGPGTGPTDATPVNEETGQFSSSASHTFTISTLPAAGDLLTLSVVGSGPRTVSSPTDGWSILQQGQGSSHFGALLYKEAEGDETSVSITLNNATGVHYHYAQYEGTNLDISGIVSAEDESLLSSTGTSIDSGSASISTTTGLAVFMAAGDTEDNMTDGRSLTNSFSEEYFGGEGTTRGLMVADKALTTSGAVSSTFTTTDTGDQLYGAMLVVPGTGSGSSDTPFITVTLTTGSLPGELGILITSTLPNTGVLSAVCDSTDTTEPTATQIKAGQNAASNDADWFLSENMGDSPHSMTAKDLTPGASYGCYATHTR